MNIKVSKEELDFIRSLEDFDLKNLLSEIDEHGWINKKYPALGGKMLIPLIANAIKTRKGLQ